MRIYGLAEELPKAGSPWDLIWVLFVLGVIVFLIVLLLRFFAKRNRGWWMNRSLRSLGGLPLGTNKSLQIVEWSGRIYVLGVGDDVTLLDAIAEPEAVAAILAEYDASMAHAGNPLPEWLRKWKARGGSGNEETALRKTDGAPTFEQTLEHRLRQLSERKQQVEQLLSDSRDGERTDKP